MSSSYNVVVSGRSGAVAPLTVVCLALLVSMVALVIDGGTLMESRRSIQAAVDAAALAGADDLYLNYPLYQGIDANGTASTSAQQTASANGFTGPNSTVTISTAGQTYQGGPNVGQTIPPGYIEVIIQYNAARLFSGIFGSGVTPVSARAVARGRCAPININNGLLALSLNLSAALNVSSTASVLASPGGVKVKGGIQVNSSNSQSIAASGNVQLSTSQLTINPASTGLLSGILSLVTNLLAGPPPTPKTSPSIPDPLRYLSPPNTTPLLTRGTNLSISSGIVSLYPGIYNGGIRVSGTAIVILHANSDGTPGIYYLNGQNGLQITSGATVKTASGETAGIMLYNNWSDSNDAISVSGSGSLSIIPPASGVYRGLSIFQKRGTPSSLAPTLTLGGTGNISLAGTIYAAHAGVSLSGNSTFNTMGGQIIADSIKVSGSVQLNIDPGSYPTANQRILGLVE